MSIVVKGITKIYPGNKVLDNISLCAEKGQILGLIGPSGAGKTTLIRLIIGAIPSDEGVITIGDIKVPDKQLLKNIGYMPQSEGLYSDLSGIENLKFYGRLYGLRGKKLSTRCNELMEYVGLEKESNKLVANYSFGMRKRLSLTICLIHDPEYLIMDEPTVGIDPRVRQKIWKLFNRLLEQGKTIIISTHVMEEAERCDNCALIQDGKILAYGSTKDLINSTKNRDLEELFLMDIGGDL